MEAYVLAILREAELRKSEISDTVETVYFGGGTPSLLPVKALRSVIQGLRNRLPIAASAEWTVEANPGSIDSAWLTAAREEGINRLSIGMQAAQDRLLKTLGRIHRSDDTIRSVKLARQAGFDNLNLDLIFGLPTQSRQEWLETMDAALSLKPSHISAYGLIPEEGTPLWNDLQSGRLSLPEPEVEREMYDSLLLTMKNAGFIQYEISNFALPGFACQHNIGYWTQVSYVGLGLGAASMTCLHKDSKGGIRYLRRTALTDLDDYLDEVREGCLSWSEESWIEPRESCFETMMLGLRMNQGVSEESFQDLHGQTLESCYGPKLRHLEERGLLEHASGRWKLTRLGMDLQNTALVELMDD